jgi:hypothetical protein
MAADFAGAVDYYAVGAGWMANLGQQQGVRLGPSCLLDSAPPAMRTAIADRTGRSRRGPLAPGFRVDRDGADFGGYDVSEIRRRRTLGQ